MQSMRQNSGSQGISYTLDRKRTQNEEEIFARSIFISGLNYDSTEQEIKEVFEQCGEIE